MEWEAKFDEKFLWGPEWDEDLAEEIKQFISTLLENQKKEIGNEFKDWFNNSQGEMIEEAIERITNVKV